MQKVKKADKPAETPAVAGENVSASNPPRGEDIDGGDVDEVIRLDAGEAIEIVYRGYKETKGKKPGEISRLHKLVMLDGVSRGLWGTQQLNSMLDKCNVGDSLWIAYIGKTEIAGGNTLHNWKVVRTAKAR